MYTRQGQQFGMNETLDTTNASVTGINVTRLFEYERYTVVVYGETDAGVGTGSDPLDVLTDQGGEGMSVCLSVCFINNW